MLLRICFLALTDNVLIVQFLRTHLRFLAASAAMHLMHCLNQLFHNAYSRLVIALENNFRLDQCDYNNPQRLDNLCHELQN